MIKHAKIWGNGQSLLHRIVDFELSEKWAARLQLIFFSLILGLICINEFWVEGLNVFEWDVLLISGLAMLIIGIWLSMGMPTRMENMLDRLVNRGVLQATPEKLAESKRCLKLRANVWAFRSGLIVAIAILIAFLVAYWPSFSFFVILETIMEVIGGWIAGRYLGRMASYGKLKFLLEEKKASLEVKPGHPDGAAGLKPIGHFYFFQAMVLSIPALFLAVWWLIIPFWVNGLYMRWRAPYLGLLPIAIIFEILAFLVPIWFFHREMQNQKKVLLKNADALSRGIVEIQAQLAESKADEQRDLLEKQLSRMIERYWSIEQMPTWPLDPKTRRSFTLSNLSLLIPLISDFIAGTSTWQDIVKSIGDIIES